MRVHHDTRFLFRRINSKNQILKNQTIKIEFIPLITEGISNVINIVSIADGTD